MKYGALISRSVTIPGDERSRTHPGHGYPKSMETFTDLKTFAGLAEMDAWVKQQTMGMYSKPNFTLIHYEELEVETSVAIKIKTKP